MGKQDQKFNTASGSPLWSAQTDTVFSDDGFPRYKQRWNRNGGRRYGQFSMRPENRDATGGTRTQFSARRGGRRSRGYKRVLRNKNRAD